MCANNDKNIVFDTDKEANNAFLQRTAQFGSGLVVELQNGVSHTRTHTSSSGSKSNYMKMDFFFGFTKYNRLVACDFFSAMKEFFSLLVRLSWNVQTWHRNNEKKNCIHKYFEFWWLLVDFLFWLTTPKRFHHRANLEIGLTDWG